MYKNKEDIKMNEKLTLEIFNGWVKGKVYNDVADRPDKYREFCALVTFTPEKGETKTYLPYSKGSDVSFNMNNIKVGDVLYMGYVNERKRRTEIREYCKVIEKTDDTIILIDGYRGYLSALENKQ